MSTDLRGLRIASGIGILHRKGLGTLGEVWDFTIGRKKLKKFLKLFLISISKKILIKGVENQKKHPRGENLILKFLK